MPLAPASLRGLPRETFVLAVVAFCVALGFGIVAPAIPLFALEFGVSTTAAGAVVSAFALMRLVSGLAGGALVDRVGERTALVAGISVVAVSSLFAGLAVSYPQLLVLRGVGGVGSAVFTIAATSLLLRVAGAAQRGQTQGVYRAGFLLGGIVGPGLGGAVLGVSLRAPFFLYAATLVLAALAGALLLPRERGPAETAPGPSAGIGSDGAPSTDVAADAGSSTGSGTGAGARAPATVDGPSTTGPTSSPTGAAQTVGESSTAPPAGGPTSASWTAGGSSTTRPTGGPTSASGTVHGTSTGGPSAGPTTAAPLPERTSLREALAAPAYRAALAGNFAVGFSVLGVRSTVVPLLVVQGLGLAGGWIGAAFLVSALVQTVLLLPAGRVVDTAGRRPALVVGGLVTAASLAALAGATGPTTLLLAMTCFGAGASLLGVAPAALVGDVVRGRGGTAVAVWQMSSDLGSVLGPLAAGMLVDQAGFGVALLVSAAVVAVCGVLGLSVPRDHAARAGG